MIGNMGLTASIMGILAKYDAQILDIGQADIHSTLSLGILIRMEETHSGQVMKELLFKATELGVNIGFSPISDDEYEDWVGHQGKNRYILMVMGRQLEARQIEGATRILADQGFHHSPTILLVAGARPSTGNPHADRQSVEQVSREANTDDCPSADVGTLYQYQFPSTVLDVVAWIHAKYR